MAALITVAVAGVACCTLAIRPRLRRGSKEGT